MTLEQREANLAAAAHAAVLCELSTKVPALLSVAQWALESGWGKHQPGNNCFGIKVYDGCYGRQQLLTTEYIKGQKLSLLQWFATFATLFDCFEKHARLIANGKPYQKAFAQYKGDFSFEGLVQGIAPIYATDPRYAEIVLQLAYQPNVFAAVERAFLARQAA